MTVPTGTGPTELDRFPDRVAGRVDRGARFCGLLAAPAADGTRLVAVLAEGGGLHTESAVVPDGCAGFPTLTGRVAGATWYEREIHDLFGLVAIGHRNLDPLVLPLAPGSSRPCPGSGKPRDAVELDVAPLPPRLRGEGVFTIPYGPVRSGVFESVEYLVETPGEDIPSLRTRVFYKHRGIEARFEGMDAADGTLLAERTEGVASVAHAVAFAGAVERLAGVEVPEPAGLVRVVHAELERIANHLDSTIRHSEGAGQAVAFARLSLHKERLLRLRARLCGSRFGRGVVVPGGVSSGLGAPARELYAAIDQLQRDIRADLRMLMGTPSFLDRLRGTGVVPADLAQDYGALGPLGRGSGQTDDARLARPYAAYGRLGHQLFDPHPEGDALARQRVRIDEIEGAFHLIRQAVDRLEEVGGGGTPWAVDVGDRVGGEAVGWAEAPQGEVFYFVTMDDGRLTRVKPRSASFHNLGLFHVAFPNDILTDFAFIEASFGLSIAGVAG